MRAYREMAADQAREQQALEWSEGLIADACPARWGNPKDASNRNLNRVQVVPITSNVARVHACEAPISLNGEPRKAMADQIATVSKQRLKSRLALLALDDIRAVERAICVQLGLSGS